MHGYVYLLRDDKTGYVKIGFSRDPRRRLRQLTHEATLLPEPLTFRLAEAFEGTHSEERRLHKIYAKRRVRGEWFDLCFWRFMDICYAFDSRPRLAGIEWNRCDDLADPFSVLNDDEFCLCDECRTVS